MIMQDYNVIISQAILRQLGQINNEPLMTDESELQCHQQLKKLYKSTKTAKVQYFSFVCMMSFYGPMADR